MSLPPFRTFAFAMAGLVILLGALMVLTGLGPAFAPLPVYAQAASATPVASVTPGASATLVAQTTPVATPQAASYQRTVSVSGTGSVNVQPDIAIIGLGVQTDAQTASQALSQNSQQMQAVLDVLKKAGVASADIRTQYVQLYPRYSNPQPLPQIQPNQTAPTAEPNRIIGYTASNTVQVTVRNLNNLGSLLDQAVTAGGNQIESINFDLANPAQSMDRARDAAMQDAGHRAQQLANLANQRLGQVISIQEASRGPITFPAADMRLNSAAMAVPVSPGVQPVTVEVQVTWEL